MGGGGSVQALAHARAVDALPLQIAVVGTGANIKHHVLNVVFLKTASSCGSKPHKRAHVAAEIELAQAEGTHKGGSVQVIYPHCDGACSKSIMAGNQMTGRQSQPAPHFM